MKKKAIILISAVLIVLAGAFYFFAIQTPDETQEQAVLEQTVTLSKDYLALRLQTDSLLINAADYPDYQSWNTEMTRIIDDWANLEQQSRALEDSALTTAAESAANFDLIQSAHAYSAKEISNIYDKAPRFQGIATLAKHLGVDAKRAQAILDQAQAETTAGVFTEEGNAYENLENTAIVVKDGCKVAGFVGGVVLTGGAAGFAAAGTMAQVGTVVVGVDLALEVTEDGAQIAFGDKNKVSSFVKDVRTVTEPIATVISITNVPGNLGSAYGRFESVMVGLEQFRESAQEGKVVGIDLTNFEYHKPFQVIRRTKYPGTVSAAEMEMAEVEAWLQSLNMQPEPMTREEVEQFLAIASGKTDTKTTEPENTEPAKQLEKENEVNQAEEKKDETSKTTNNATELMPVDEFQKLFADFAIETISDVKEIFGEPDVINTLDDGYGNYVYHRRLVYPNGNIAGMMIRFQNQEVGGYSIMMEQ